VCLLLILVTLEPDRGNVTLVLNHVDPGWNRGTTWKPGPCLASPSRLQVGQDSEDPDVALSLDVTDESLKPDATGDSQASGTMGHR